MFIGKLYQWNGATVDFVFLNQSIDVHNGQVGKYLTAGIRVRMPAIPGEFLPAEKSLTRPLIVKKAVGIFYQRCKNVISGI